MSITTHNLECACCNGVAIATYEGETFVRGDYENCGLIVRMSADAHDEIVRRIREMETAR